MHVSKMMEEETTAMASEAITPVTTRTVASSCKKCSLMTLCVILGLLSLFLALLLILVIVIFSSGSHCPIKPSIRCYQTCKNHPHSCEPLDWKHRQVCSQTKRQDLFEFPPEPEHQEEQVGEPLMLSQYIQNGDFLLAKNLSRVQGLKETAADNIESYAGFITVDGGLFLKSQLYFWFFPAQHDAWKKPLVIWLQGGPGSTSMYGLLKENGPFLAHARQPPFNDPYLKRNDYSWHKVANMLYVDNPVGTGFSHTTESGYNGGDFSDHTAADQVSKELADFLLQFLQLFPYYVTSASGAGGVEPTQVYLFGESYGGTYVVNLGDYILSNPKYKSIHLSGIGIGNGWISSRYQSNYAQILKVMGLINQKTYNDLRTFENLTQLYLDQNDLGKALESWQNEMATVADSLGVSYLYDLTRSTVDVSEQNYWHFLQQSHVRKAIHVGNTILDGGYKVLLRLKHLWMEDKLSTVGKLLDRNVPILVYHGNFDLVLPVYGISEALHHTSWRNSSLWRSSNHQQYYHTNAYGDKELMGYRQSGGGLTFVVVRNSGHMVPMDSPSWALQILRDFLHDTKTEQH